MLIYDDRRKLIVIGYLSDFGDFKKFIWGFGLSELKEFL